MAPLKLSASSIFSFKSCPTRFRFAYRLGLRKIDRDEKLRMGTNWHLLQETYRKAMDDNDPERALDIALEHLNKAYETVPDTQDPFKWETERVVLAYSFMGYVWKYGGDQFETLHTEIKFDLPLIQPRTGMPLPEDEVVLVGKIDRIVRVNGRLMVVEYKSTSQDIDSGSDFWLKLKLDTQLSTYSYAGRRMGMEVEGTYYDVWKKPGIKPKLLTQGETKKFIKEGEYCGVKFTVKHGRSTKLCDPPIVSDQVLVDGVLTTEIKPGAKEGVFQIRETPEMFGARLLNDIYANPDKFFARKEIARTDKELVAFESELYALYQNMKSMDRTGHYWKNETQCEATFKCDYCPICYYGRGDAVVAGETPDGFRRLQDATIGKSD